ncbi:hypothetical protein [Alteromonas genovensis]|uniref:hypothetical protein n=1 Tax=Alteromonas genovensis TaxID=471225 RepID=UPI002FE0A8C1
MGNKHVSLSMKGPEKDNMSTKPLHHSEDRRKTPHGDTLFYKVMLGLNILAWAGLVVVLILFHYARPEFITGVQQYWGVEGDNTWTMSYVDAMVVLLRICLVLSLISTVMRARRSRRKNDSFGINLIILTIIVATSLITLATTVS